MLTILAVILLLLALFNLFAGFRALIKIEPIHSIAHMTISVSFFLASIACLLGFITLKGYQSFTYEALAAKVHIAPDKDRQFSAHFTFPDGSKQSFQIHGDELYVDAQILKWSPMANFFGIHTSFQLARVGGRYHSVADELKQKRSLYPLGEENPSDLFKLRQQFAQLAFMVDAQYGSASFIPAKEGDYLLLVSTSGLLFRKSLKP